MCGFIAKIHSNSHQEELTLNYVCYTCTGTTHPLEMEAKKSDGEFKLASVCTHAPMSYGSNLCVMHLSVCL